MRNLLCSPPDAASYVHVLQALGQALQHIEPPVIACLNNPPGSGGTVVRSRLAALERDLGNLGQSLPPPAVSGCAFSGVAELVGAAYVLEGARLGGQFLAARIRQSAGASLPCEFFAGDGEDTGVHWRRFLDCAETMVAPQDFDAAIRGAQHAFACFQACCDQMHVATQQGS